VGGGVANGRQGGSKGYEAYEVKKKGKIALSLTSPEKDFIYIYL
jgi:hypothetical protein